MKPILIAIAAATLILLGLQSAADLSRPTGGSVTVAQGSSSHSSAADTSTH
ncbi:MAG: hypothetical protein JWQ90_5183 [Hydrocarboniphaga sp.]|uniref:hypothetical protein n=1 Tax=Hydrocarboniphaga sp. TaxID=2033016 RepID=UPI002601D25D|nr:hypothetical protein [Hydrocarboniphaga sp.]MDB5972733.1 hypothetical protein [Hydrocarboniphaga sp.]